MEFSADLQAEVERLLRNYPEPMGALLPILNAVQDAQGYISPAAVEEVARTLACTSARVWEVVQFYAVFHTEPAATCRIQVCRTLSCRLVGAEDVVACLRDHLKAKTEQETGARCIEIESIDCIGACATAPVMLVDGKLHQSLTREYIAHLLGAL